MSTKDPGLFLREPRRSPRAIPLELRVLGFEPCGLDALQARCGLDLPTLQARLLELEFDGWVARLPGGVYQRRARS